MSAVTPARPATLTWDQEESLYKGKSSPRLRSFCHFLDNVPPLFNQNRLGLLQRSSIPWQGQRSLWEQLCRCYSLQRRPERHCPVIPPSSDFKSFLMWTSDRAEGLLRCFSGRMPRDNAAHQLKSESCVFCKPVCLASSTKVVYYPKSFGFIDQACHAVQEIFMEISTPARVWLLHCESANKC